MSVCKYCGQKVGWFSDAHEDCTRKVTQGIESLKSRVADSIVQGKQYGDTKAELEKISNESFIPKSESLVALKEGGSGEHNKGASRSRLVILSFLPFLISIGTPG